MRAAIGLDEPDIGMGQDQAEEGNLLPSAPDLDRRLAEVDLGMARRMMKGNEGLARRLPPGPDIVLHDGIAAGEPVLVAKALEDPVRRVTLLARHVGSVSASRIASTMPVNPSSLGRLTGFVRR